MVEEKVNRLVLKADSIYEKFRRTGIVSSSSIEKVNNVLLKLSSLDDEVENKKDLANLRRTIILMIDDMTDKLNSQVGIVT